MSGFQLTSDAAADLLEIARYTIQKWGKARAKKYEQKLKESFATIGRGEAHARILFENWPELRFSHCEHHYIFFLMRPAQSTAIIAILHERMNMIQRIRARLDLD